MKKIWRKKDLVRANKSLVRINWQLTRGLDAVMKLFGEGLTCFSNLKTRQDVIEELAKQKIAASDALQDYIQAEQYRESQRQKLSVGDILVAAMTVLMSCDRRSQKIPWVYYNPVRQKIYQSPAAREFLRTGKKEISLGELLWYVQGENKEEVENALNLGQFLKHHKIHFLRKYSKKATALYLTTYGFCFEDRNVGSAVFLYDPTFSFHRMSVSRFAKSIESIGAECLEKIISNNYSINNPH